ncbi:hypothetical protein GCM10020369_20190 [Cryptosporangium minutisporangium]|uniref:Transposase n=1 Tax=Cryptosporangium minutisporangium TaxID=113569 RepID=A0ABP6SUM8_9ACTN
MAAKRGDRVAPPGKPGGWEARFATSEAAQGWEALCQSAKSNTWEAWIVLTERPTAPVNPARQHRLYGSLGHREIGGRPLEKWQYEVTAGGRSVVLAGTQWGIGSAIARLHVGGFMRRRPII